MGDSLGQHEAAQAAFELGTMADDSNLAGRETKSRGKLANSFFLLAAIDHELLRTDRRRGRLGLEGPLDGPVMDLGYQVATKRR